MPIPIVARNSFVQKLIWRFLLLKCYMNRISAKFRQILMS